MKHTDSFEDATRSELVQELHVHQSELEAQNQELRDAQEYTTRSLERFENLFQDAPIPYVSLNAEGVVLDANRAALELLGRERQRILKHPFVLVLGPEFHAPFFRYLRTVLSTREEHRVSVQMTGGDGELREVVLVGTPSRSVDGSHQCLTALLDMTTVRRYHAELDETRERFTGLMQHTADAVYVSEFSVGGTGQFVDVNPGACEMLGYTREELLQRGPADIVSKTTAAEMPALIQRLRDEGHLLIETEHVARDGVALPVEVHATVVTLGGRRHVLSIARDISDRRAAQRRIEHLRDVLDAIRRANQVMLYQADPERLAEEVCNTLVDSRGYTHAWVVLFQEDDTPAPEPRVRSFHHYGMAETATAFETLLRHDGPPQCIKQAIATHDLVELDTDSVVCESCPARPVYQQGRSLSRGLRHDGRLAGILTVALKPEQRDDAEERDLLVQLSNDFGFTLWAIGEQWRRRAAFRRIEELLEREKLLARELRHRVKNDFGIVRSLLALQAMRAEDDHSRNSLDEAAGRLDTMVRIQELLLDNNDAGRVDIGVLARSIAEGAGGSDGGATVTVEAHEDDLLVSSSDAGKCGIIINELLTNAEKYAGHAARIALSVSWLSPEQVQIVCRDDGAGFSRDVLDGETSGFGLDLLRGLTGGDGEELSLENGNSGGAIVTAVVGVAAGEDNR